MDFFHIFTFVRMYSGIVFSEKDTWDAALEFGLIVVGNIWTQQSHQDALNAVYMGSSLGFGTEQQTQPSTTEHWIISICKYNQNDYWDGLRWILHANEW